MHKKWIKAKHSAILLHNFADLNNGYHQRKFKGKVWF